MLWSFTKTALASLAALALAAASFAATYSTIIERRDPITALAIWSPNGKAAARLADRAMRASLKVQQTPGAPASDIATLDAEAERLARKSLASLPLNPNALRVLGYKTTLSQEKKVEILSAASALSRRDSLTEIALIEAAAMSGNVAQALTHYDALLRRRSGFRDAAGRGLAQAVAAPELVDPIADLLRESPPWSSLLYYYLLREPGSWDGFIAMHRKLERTGEIPRDVSSSFARALVDAGRLDDAVAVAAFAKSEPLRATSNLKDTSFDIEPEFPGNWIVFDEATTALIPLAGGGAMLSISNGASGPLAARLTRQQPGNYVAAISTEDASAQDGVMIPQEVIAVSLSCNDPRQSASRTAALAVNADCPYQWLTIYLKEPVTVASDIVVDSVTVKADD